ncbi:hypothetical protein [Nostoc sp. ATCC 53789]|uniref:hypothetical protein n=1 Tax=Nostoc sp. ATCC 53789 TaxID=76335 RepID=UPI000DEC05FC|nr:hypothetical protein [Nostoc sp. ATCC 53789]QHG20667.1 hypothetical protein GJB62_32915 [Nostoc sp. ATCC 53789]RCJ33724.1 hypothetical protein A6V25_34545 [Nostoc sp. ATCC 53789]
MFAGVVPLGEEILQLKSQINALMARYSFLKPGMFFVDLERVTIFDISGDKVFPDLVQTICGNCLIVTTSLRSPH